VKGKKKNKKEKKMKNKSDKIFKSIKFFMKKDANPVIALYGYIL
jgi:hypothetical protein